MLRNNVLFLWIVSLVSAFGAQSQNPPMTRPLSLAPGFVARFDAVTEPPPANPKDLKLGFGIITNPAGIHRFVWDGIHNVYFGYDISAEPNGNGEYRITFSPLNFTPPQSLFTNSKAAPSLVTLAKYPEPQIVKAGDTIALDLLISPDGKQKIVDYIRFISEPADPPAPTSTGEPRDFTVDDGPLKLGFPALVLIDGQRFQGLEISHPNNNKSGSTLWFSFPNDGRYILSLVPHDGFRKMGVIRDNEISFQGDGHEYKVRMDDPIIVSGGDWNLYILHDPSYQWTNDDSVKARRDLYTSEPIIAGKDRLENLLPKP